jgi:hypothetical protein
MVVLFLGLGHTDDTAGNKSFGIQNVTEKIRISHDEIASQGRGKESSDEKDEADSMMVALASATTSPGRVAK